MLQCPDANRVFILLLQVVNNLVRRSSEKSVVDIVNPPTINPQLVGAMIDLYKYTTI